MKVVAWNMRFGSSPINWTAFAREGEHRCDVALLNEAKRPPDGLELYVTTTSRTIGRDDPSYGGNKVRDWSTAIASPYPIQRPKDVWALPPGEDDRRSKLMASRRGAWTAGVVSFPNGEKVTAISLYGLLDERSDASVHRSLSDLTPLLDDPRYNELLVLGGDLNPLWSADVGSMKLARVKSVFERLTRGFGLVNLLQRTLNQEDPQRGRLRSCTCSLGHECRHVQTFRKHKASTRGCQDDYLFASPAMAGRLDRCYALAFTDESPSDHVPIVATFDGF